MVKNSTKSYSKSHTSSNGHSTKIRNISGDNNTINVDNSIKSEYKHIHSSNQVTYEGDKIDIGFDKKIALLLIGKNSERKDKVGIIGLSTIIIGILEILIWLNSNLNYIPFIQLAKEGVTLMIVLYSGSIFLVIGFTMLKALSYYVKTQCEKCKKPYAYYEYKKPKVIETKVHNGTRIDKTRYYKCKFCEDIQEILYNKFIENQK